MLIHVQLKWYYKITRFAIIYIYVLNYSAHQIADITSAFLHHIVAFLLLKFLINFENYDRQHTMSWAISSISPQAVSTYSSKSSKLFSFPLMSSVTCFRGTTSCSSSSKSQFEHDSIKSSMIRVLVFKGPVWPKLSLGERKHARLQRKAGHKCIAVCNWKSCLLFGQGSTTPLKQQMPLLGIEVNEKHIGCLLNNGMALIGTRPSQEDWLWHKGLSIRQMHGDAITSGAHLCCQDLVSTLVVQRQVYVEMMH